MPFRTCARLLKPRGPSRWPPRVARSWTGLCEWPPRPPRGSNRSTVRCPLLFPDANSGLVGCLGCSDVEFDRGKFPGDSPSKSPTGPDNQGVCYRTRCSVCRQAASQCGPAGSTWGAVLAQGALAWMCCEVRLLGDCFCFFGGPPLRREEIASCMPHRCHRPVTASPKGPIS